MTVPRSGCRPESSLAAHLAREFGPKAPLARQCVGGLGRVAPDDWHQVMRQTCGERLDRVAEGVPAMAKNLGLGPGGDPQAILFGVQAYYSLVIAGVTRALAPEASESVIAELLPAALRTCPVAMQSLSAIQGRAESLPPANQVSCPDVFKELHHALFPRRLRHAMGEYYTPDWLADHVLDVVGFEGRGAARVLDPTCGSGTFLMQAIGRIRAAQHGDQSPRERLDEIASRVAGIDLSPLAAATARANYLIATADLLLGASDFRPPIFERDAILGVPEGEALARPFDCVVGNPPWIAWDNLPADYREATKPLWIHYGLFSLGGTAARHGGGKKDLSMLLVYIAADRYLADGGRLGMVLTQTALQTKGAGDGFRRFTLPDGRPLGVVRADDFVAVRPFREAANWTCTLVLEKGRAVEYPVPYYRWRPEPTDHGPMSTEAGSAWPIDVEVPSSPWFVPPREVSCDLRAMVGKSDYRAYLGANSGGANGVYWVELLGEADGGVRIRPSAAVADEEYVVERDRLYPLLRWGRVDRFDARPRGAILMVQDAQRRSGLGESWMAEHCPKTLAYLRRSEAALRRRAAYQRYQAAGPFYSMYNVGLYTLSPIKVVWRRMDKRIRAAVVEEVDDPLLGRRPVVPQETCVLVPCETLDEAHYLAAMMNSSIIGALVAAHSVSGGKGFGTPSVLDYLGLRRFDPANSHHARLAELSRAAHAAGPSAETDRAIDDAMTPLCR